MQHGAVTTARQTVHWRPDGDVLCPVCRLEAETLHHYFHGCVRVREFWALVAAFLDRIQASPPAQPSPVALKDVMAGLPLWSKTVPSMAVFHAAAVWQIYRAHTEALLDNKVVPALTMLGRWQGSMKLRIKFDLISARKADKLDQFESHWTKTKCKRFAFEPGGGGVGCERLVFDPACYAPDPPPAGNDEQQDPA